MISLLLDCTINKWSCYQWFETPCRWYDVTIMVAFTHHAACDFLFRPLRPWRHNERDGVSNHQPHDCILNLLFRHRSKKTWKRRVTGLCAWNSSVTGEFPAQSASNAENVSIWWRHHVDSNTMGDERIHLRDAIDCETDYISFDISWHPLEMLH